MRREGGSCGNGRELLEIHLANSILSGGLSGGFAKSKPVVEGCGKRIHFYATIFASKSFQNASGIRIGRKVSVLTQTYKVFTRARSVPSPARRMR